MTAKSAPPKKTRSWERHELVPIGLTFEHAHGIVVVHRDKGKCTAATCLRLAAALERIKIEEEQEL